MPDAPLRIRGFTCPFCPGVALRVYKSRRPCAGVVIRYRRCPDCAYRKTTRETSGKDLPPAPPWRPAEPGSRADLLQRELLRVIVASGRGDQFRLREVLPTTCSRHLNQLDRLIDAGLVERVRTDAGPTYCRLTPAGREAAAVTPPRAR